MEEQIPSLSDVLSKQLLLLERDGVRSQLIAIALSLFAGWLLSKWLWRWLQKTFPQTTEFIWDDARLPPRQYLAALIQHLDFPIISLIALNLSRNFFIAQNWIQGLLRVAIQVIWFYLAYRLFLVSLYAAFSLVQVRRYHFRLFAPLFILFVLRTIINLYQNLEQLAQISPFKLFNSPITLGGIFFLTVGLYFWMVTITLLETVILGLFRAKSQLESGTLEASFLLIRYFLMALGIVLILGYIGVDGTALAAITGGLSVGIGFGLQQVISNFVSGIVLLFEGALKPGDIIDIQGQTSQVKKLGIRATTVRVLTDNSEKIIPNQTFFTSDVTTYTGSDRLLYCSIAVGVSYDANVKQVMDLLLQIAQQHPSVLKQPVPVAFLLNFGDSSLNFELKFWLDNINIKKRVISDLSCAILATFAENKIEIPFPQRDIHIRVQAQLNQ